MSDSDPVDLNLQTPLSMGFSSQEGWSGLPCPPPGDLPYPGIEHMSLTSALAGGFFTISATWVALLFSYLLIISMKSQTVLRLIWEESQLCSFNLKNGNKKSITF